MYRCICTELSHLHARCLENVCLAFVLDFSIVQRAIGSRCIYETVRFLPAGGGYVVQILTVQGCYTVDVAIACPFHFLVLDGRWSWAIDVSFGALQGHARDRPN